MRPVSDDDPGSTAERPGAPSGPFRVTFVTGVMPDKWARRWQERERTPLELVPVDELHQLDALENGTASMALARGPVGREGRHRIPLYVEDVVVVVSHEHPAAAYDSIAVADLADEHLLQDPDSVPEWRDLASEVRDGTRYPVPAMSLSELMASVAADAGIAFLPRSVARVHHRKDVRAVAVPELPGPEVGLVWPTVADDPRIETFIGVVRGRTPRSSRGAETPGPVKKQQSAAARSSRRRPGPQQRQGGRRRRT